MSYSAVFFDMDGTVLDTLGDLHAATNACLRQFGRPERTPDEVRRFVGNGSRRLLEQAMPDADAATIDAALAWYKPWYDAHSAVLTRPCPGVPALLERLRAAGLPAAILSNKPDATVRALSARFFPGLYALAAGEDEARGRRRKPWPDLLLSTAEALGLPPARCLYVGDSEVDLLTAARAGMDCAAVLWGFRSRAELEAAGGRLFFDTPAALGDWILGKS
ncbi:MAG: HAD family hydrolase [Oscillospiraceae bacterium]|nr:HAD family hydrolase [Oscillospiraceae bacterium]